MKALDEIFLVKLGKNYLHVIKVTYPYMWRILIALTQISAVGLAFVWTSKASTVSDSFVYGVCSILGIYISLSISILVQVHSQAGKHNHHHEVNVSDPPQTWPTRIFISENIKIIKIASLRNIFHLVIATIVFSVTAMLAAITPAIFEKSAPTAISIMSFAFMNLLLAYYLIIKNLYTLFADDLTEDETH